MSAPGVERAADDRGAARFPTRDALIALSLAHLFFARGLQPRVRYFTDWDPGTPVAAALDMLIVAGGVLCGVHVARRVTSRGWRTAAHVVFLLGVLFGLDAVRRLVVGDATLPPAVERLAGPVAIACAALLVGGLLWAERRREGVLPAFNRRIAAGLLIASPVALWSLGRAAVFVAAGPPERPIFPALATSAPPPPAASGAAGGRRVVVAIFDMMDYGLAFDRRPAGLELPRFDALVRQSLFATDAVSPGDATALALPSFTLGRTVRESVPVGTARLRLRLDDTTTIWQPEGTVFDSLHARGRRTALVGWYHPYCTIFAEVLQRCWSVPAKPAWGRAQRLADSHARVAEREGEPFHYDGALVRHHARLFARQRALALDAVGDSSVDVVFLHLAVPHFPFIWDRHRGETVVRAPGGADGYLDNLALADRTLGELLDRLAASGLDSSTAVVVTSDHRFQWSERVDGKEDMRVPFIVRLPGATEGAVYARPMNTALLGPLMLRLAGGELPTTRALVEWLGGQDAMRDERSLATRD